MSSLNIDTSKLNRKAKESFANSLIDFGAGAARYATYVVLVIPATIFVKLILDEKDIFAFLWNNVHVLLVLSSIFALGMVLGAVVRNQGIMLLNELPDCRDAKDGNQPDA